MGFREKRMDRKLVFTNGCFDVFHYGHLHILREAAKLGNLVVGINSDKSIRKLKGDGRPIFPLKYRQQIISSLFFVDTVRSFNEETPLNLISRIKPDILVKGGDYEIESIVGYEFVTKNGGQVITIPLIKDLSSTNILEKLEKL